MNVVVGDVAHATLSADEHLRWREEGPAAARFRVGLKREARLSAGSARRIFILGPSGDFIAEIPTVGEIEAANAERALQKALGPGPR